MQISRFKDYYNITGTCALEEAQYVFLPENHNDEEMMKTNGEVVDWIYNSSVGVSAAYKKIKMALFHEKPASSQVRFSYSQCLLPEWGWDIDTVPFRAFKVRLIAFQQIQANIKKAKGFAWRHSLFTLAILYPANLKIARVLRTLSANQIRELMDLIYQQIITELVWFMSFRQSNLCKTLCCFAFFDKIIIQGGRAHFIGEYIAPLDSFFVGKKYVILDPKKFSGGVNQPELWRHTPRVEEIYCAAQYIIATIVFAIASVKQYQTLHSKSDERAAQ